MYRWDIINHLIKKNGYTRYLEIGYYKGWSFDNVKCDEKTAVDPNPCKTIDQEKLVYGDSVYSNVNGEKETSAGIIKLTSDDFFEGLKEPYKIHMRDNRILHEEILKWDIIFIDGLHESKQVDKDIQNALKHLNPGGTIVMHDCLPTSLEMVTVGTQQGEWTGDVYKSFIKFRFKNLYAYNAYVVNTDYGVGIIKRTGRADAYVMDMGNVEWKTFDANRNMYLNLITPEEFLKREPITSKLPGVEDSLVISSSPHIVKENQGKSNV